MTHRVLKSKIYPSFEADVALFAKEIRDWRKHDQRVREDENNNVTGPNKHVSHPRPVMSQMVEACVNENGIADYTIDDDGPTPDQIFALKKQQLLNDAVVAEVQAIAAIVPPGKHRIFLLREFDIRSSEETKRQEILNRKYSASLLEKIKEKFGIVDPLDINAELLKQRTPEDQKFLDDQADRNQRIQAVQRAVANVQAEIEDLTPADIDAWKMPDFPK